MQTFSRRHFPNVITNRFPGVGNIHLQYSVARSAFPFGPCLCAVVSFSSSSPCTIAVRSRGTPRVVKKNAYTMVCWTRCAVRLRAIHDGSCSSEITSDREGKQINTLRNSRYRWTYVLALIAIDHVFLVRLHEQNRDFGLSLKVAQRTSYLVSQSSVCVPRWSLQHTFGHLVQWFLKRVFRNRRVPLIDPNRSTRHVKIFENFFCIDSERDYSVWDSWKPDSFFIKTTLETDKNWDDSSG